MIKEDAAGGMQPVALPVVDGDPMGVELRHTVGRPRIERGRLPLRRFHDLAIHLGTRGLVEPDLTADGVLKVTNRLQQPERAHGSDVRGVRRLVEAHAHVALRRKVVDLRRPNLADQTGETVAIGHVAMMQHERPVHVVDVMVEMLDPLRAESARSTHETMHLVPLVEEEFGKVRAILAGNPGDQRSSYTR